MRKVVQMDFDEGDRLSQPQVSRSASSSQTNLREEASRRNSCRVNQHQSSWPDHPPSRTDWDTATVLDATCNRLQELMQLLYLLGRDPAVPNDARYHVTVAQSEIALLTRAMQNSASAAATNRG
jgi:hypothetical protein